MRNTEEKRGSPFPNQLQTKRTSQHSPPTRFKNPPKALYAGAEA